MYIEMLTFPKGVVGCWFCWLRLRFWTPTPTFKPTDPIVVEAQMALAPFPHGLVEHRGMLHQGFPSRATGETHEHENCHQQTELGNSQTLLKNDLGAVKEFG